MKHKTLARVLLCVFIFGVLLMSAFVDTNQKPTGENVAVIGDYQDGNPALAELPAENKQNETKPQAEGFLDAVTRINGFLNANVAWGIFMCFLLVGTGVYISIRLRFMQFRRAGHIIRNTLGKVFEKKPAQKDQKGAITPFQALCTALAATVGTGNIAGVTGAIVLGGPGAVFWMWVAALFGMCTKYAEIVLAVHYREKDEKGEWIGGPMYYIKNGLGKGWRWLGVMFSVFGAVTALGTGSMTQINTIAGTLITAVDSVTQTAIKDSGTEIVLRWIIGIVIAGLSGLVIIGGINRLGRVTEKLVPTMSLFYIIGSLIVIFVNADRIGMAFGSVFKAAFSKEAMFGGVSGFVLMNAMKKGIGRGVFSNEAGLGSAPIAHASSSETNPVKQGFFGVFEVFTVTMVICTMTALVVLLSDVVPWGNAEMAGAETTIRSFGTVFGKELSSVFIALAIFFFAFSTILSWSLYGQRCVGFLTHNKGIIYYQILYVVSVVAGATMKLSLVWDIADTMNGFMAIPNLIALIVLSGTVARLTREYFRRSPTELRQNA